MKTLSYGRQVANSWTKTKSLSVECYLMTPTDVEIFGDGKKKGTKSPLFMQSGMSRFYMTIIDTMQKVNDRSATISANFPAEDIDLALRKTEAIIPIVMENDGTPATVSGDTPNTPAYTVPIAGKFGKQTAASILIATPGRRGELKDQISWLSDNLSKYPANAKQIKAIKEAIALFDKGELVGSKGAVIEKSIYTSPCKYFPNRTDGRGWNVCYRIKISYNSGSATPVHIHIENFLAPLVLSKAGTKVIKLSEADNRLVGTLDVTFDEWYRIIKRMADTKKNFETINFPKMWKIMEEYSWKPDAKKAASGE